MMEDLPGKVCIIGTPAEEGGAGKVKLLKNGAFDDVDFALMMHPSSGGSNLVGRGGRAACSVKCILPEKAHILPYLKWNQCTERCHSCFPADRSDASDF